MRALDLLNRTLFPSSFFRNSEKLARGWDLQREDRERFIEWFGADLVVLDGTELADRFDAYWRWQVRQTAHGELPEGSSSDAPSFELPERLLEAETVGLIYDEGGSHVPARVRSRRGGVRRSPAPRRSGPPKSRGRMPER